MWAEILNFTTIMCSIKEGDLGERGGGAGADCEKGEENKRRGRYICARGALV